MTAPFDQDALRRRAEALTGLLTGFTTDHDLVRFPHVVTLRGLSPEMLDYFRFAFLMQRATQAAVRLAPRQFRFDPIYEDHRRVGHEFRFANRLTATRFALCYEAAKNGRPCPSLSPSRA